jgi:2-dehydropantoate 2-reductase
MDHVVAYAAMAEGSIDVTDVYTTDAIIAQQDLVVLSVKTTALASVPASIAPLLGPDTVVLSAMNGVPWWFFQGLPEPWRGTRLEATDPGGHLAAAIDPARIVGCVVHMAAWCPTPGTVRQAFGDRFIVGEPGGVTALAALTSGAYVPAAGERVGVLICGANADPGWFL